MIIGKLNVKEAELLKQIDETAWGRICLGALGYIGDKSTVNYLLKLIKENKGE